MSYRHQVLAPFGIDLYLCSRPKHWRKLRKTVTSLDEDKPGSLGYTVLASRPGEVAVVFYIDERNASGPAGLVELCAHEASHAAHFLLRHIGERKRTHEVEAYTVGWITNWLWSNLGEVN